MNATPINPIRQPATDLEIISRKKPLTPPIPEAIVRAQRTARDPIVQGAMPCGSRSEPDDSAWYCVQTQAKGEFRALLELDRGGFRPYCPMFIWQRRVKKLGVPYLDVIEPLFPRYIFVKLDITRENWRSVFGMRGVDGLMMASREVPQKLMHKGNALIAALIAEGRPGDGLLDHRDANERSRSQSIARRQAASQRLDVNYFPPVHEGASVRITTGPFAELRGICQMSSAQRITLLVSLLGRDTEVHVTRGEIEVEPS